MNDRTIRDTLAAEAAEAETRRDDAPEGMQRAHTGGGASQVYTVRMPHERLDELRTIASEAGEQPTALLRRWVLERLDAERAHQPGLSDVRRNLSGALTALDRIGTQRHT